MELDGPVFIYRWEHALEHTEDSITWRDDLRRVITVPFGVRKDHAEGITLIPVHHLLVCYDSPDQSRLDGSDEDGVRADMFTLPV